MMIKELNLILDGTEQQCFIDFQYFKEDGEVTIQIETIMCNGIEVSELVEEKDMEYINWKCQEHYENTAFAYWEQRYEERNSGLARD